MTTVHDLQMKQFLKGSNCLVDTIVDLRRKLQNSLSHMTTVFAPQMQHFLR